MVGLGEVSETRVRELALRAARYGAPIRIIYIADFDPGGRSMPKAVARKIEFTIAKLGLDVDLQLIPLALTPEQCRHYGLPRTPIKETERRKDKFESIFGVGATELDALEALHPGELARLLNEEIDNWIDASLSRRFNRLEAEINIDLRRITSGVLANHAEEIEQITLQFEQVAQKLKDASAEFSSWEEQAAELWERITNELDEADVDFSDVEVPQSEAPGETDRFVLFDSRRDYFSQMDAYNAWRDGTEFNGAAP